MHRSRLSTFVIDCKVDDLDAAAEFWSKALHRELHPPDADDPGYRQLTASDDEPLLLLQKVEHDSRIHLDIESDDLDAEVARLEKLGARRIKFVKRWWVMQAPTGQVFCVVRPQRGPLADKPNANEWP
ncbi:MAG TPA: VOC family protein [Kofleriaceae bacterium]|nr:VOC family protein [Kofleriaceae bacterium]